jgi:ribosomal-protein-alanine N-acetyltransferase
MDALATTFGSIRPWQESDAAALVKYANNRKIWANLRDGFHFPYNAEHARAFLDLVGRQNPTTYFAIATPEEAIGSIGLSLGQDVHRLTAEMGYWLAEPFWGRGIMSEAVARFTDAAFAAFELVRIYAEPYATNTNSCRILEKAGFTFEGRLRSSVIKDGKILDQLMYARTKPGT